MSAFLATLSFGTGAWNRCAWNRCKQLDVLQLQVSHFFWLQMPWELSCMLDQ